MIDSTLPPFMSIKLNYCLACGASDVELYPIYKPVIK